LPVEQPEQVFARLQDSPLTERADQLQQTTAGLTLWRP